MTEASVPKPTIGNDTVVFIPAWNEEANLPAVFDELAEVLPGVDILVVDDGSTDDTAALASDRGATVVSFGENHGLRAVIATGYREAHDRGYSYCGRVDADGQHPAEELLRLLALVRSGTCDVAVGSRFATDADHDSDNQLIAFIAEGIDLDEDLSADGLADAAVEQCYAVNALLLRVAEAEAECYCDWLLGIDRQIAAAKEDGVRVSEHEAVHLTRPTTALGQQH